MPIYDPQFLTPEEFLAARPAGESPQVRFVAAARSLLGAKYQHQGRDPLTGIDCLGVIEFSGYLCGWMTRDQYNRDYLSTPDGVKLARGLASRLDEIPLDEASDGDIYLLRFARDPQHVAVLCSNSARYPGPGIVHGYKGKSGLQSHVLEEPITRWLNHLVKAFRLPANLTTGEGY